MNLFSMISRDSISSNQGDDSNRSSIITLSRPHIRNHNKKISIDLRTFTKLTNFLSTVLKEFNLNLEDFKEITTLAEYAQTEEVNISLIDQENKDELSIDNNNQVEELNQKILLYRKELDDKEVKNNSLVIENSKLKEELDKNKDEIIIIQEEKGKLENQIYLHRQEIETLLIERNNFSKNIDIVENKNTKDVNIVSTEGLELKENQINYFSDEKLIKNIACYLNPKEYILFSNIDRNTKNILLSHNSMIALLKLSINSKNHQISKLRSFDWNKEYEISDVEIEKLIKEYIQINKIPGLDLKNLLTNALNYIKNDIKKYLGIIPQQELEAPPKKSSSFLSSLNNVFSKIVNKKEETKVKKLPGTFENISEYDNYLITDFSNNFLLNVEFDINSSEELKTLLVTFFTSVRNNPQSISNFIAKLINEYADFVFYAYWTLVEIKEIEIVKNAMHERFRKYYKICSELENELDDLKKFAKTNKEIKDILLRQKQEIEVKYTDCNTQITYLKDELNKTSNKLLTTTEKYNKIEQEYDTFKAKLVKEFKFLKSEYETAQSERNLLKEALYEFKKYFMRFHLTDDGDINYVEADNN